MFMLYVDLAELPRLFDGTPFWSARRPALAWFKRSDYLGPAHRPLEDAVRDLVAARTGSRPRGPIRLLTHLRYFGYCMNPVSFYYCFDAADGAVETIVAEITNTPWGERHQYVLPITPGGGKRAAGLATAAPGTTPASGAAAAAVPGTGAGGTAVPAAAGHAGLTRFEFDKDFHVSPFMPMDMQYRWCFSAPADRLFVNMQNFHRGQNMFDATLALRQVPLTRWSLICALGAFPLMTLKVVAAIHWQALKLWLKRTPVYGHPRQASG